MKKIFMLISMIFMGIGLAACDSSGGSYTVSFDTDGGSVIESQNVAKGGLVNRPSDPTKADYRFKEWQLDNTTYNFENKVTSDMTLKATYTSTAPGDANYTVNFITNNDTTLQSVTVTSSDLLIEPSLTKDGYTLFGWRIVGTNNYFNFATDYATSNMTLEAIWEFIPSVDIDSLDVFISEIYENNKVYTDRYIEIFNPTSTEIQLDGYSLKSAYNNASLDNPSKTLKLDNYSIPAKACLVIYDTKASESFLTNIMTSNSISSDVIIHDADDRYGLYNGDVLIDTVEQASDDHSAKDSRMIRNYECSATNTFDLSQWTVLSAADESALNSAGIHKLFSTDIDPIVHSVTFDTDGGTQISSLKVINNTILNITLPSKSGYELVGWTVNGAPFDIEQPITSSITIKAVWEKINLEDVVLDVFFSEIFETNAATNDRYIEIFNPTEDSINLDNYAICPEYNSTLPTISSKYKISLEGYVIKPFSTIVIYDEAMNKDLVDSIPGEKIATANIFHDGNDNYGLFKDGEMIDMLGYLTSDNYHQNLSLRRNELVYGSTSFNHNDWTGYTANATGGMDDAGKHYFKEIPTYTITFDTDGGTDVVSQTIKTGATISAPTAPTRDGYKFVCWMNGNEEFDLNTEIKANYTLTAKWDVFVGEMYVVTFDTNGGTAINNQNVYEGDLVIKPENPYLYNHDLIGWTLNGNPFDFNTTKIDSNITLVAVWEEKVFYTITFETEGTEVEQMTIESTQYILEPTTTRLGYEFIAWTTADGTPFDFTKLLDESVDANNELVLYATWNQLTYTPSTYTVSSVSEYNNQIKSLLPGDTLIFADGTYNASSMSSLSASISGTDFAPITIKAETVGGVIFTTKSTQEIKGDYITISGFTFTDGTVNSATGVYVIYGTGVRITNVTIDAFDSAGVGADISKSSYITIKDEAKYTEIDNCSFLNKNSPGVLLLVDKYSDDPSYVHIHHNYFYNYTNPDPVAWTNELETIRIGWSGHSQTASYTVVEHNIFEEISSETELVSVKSGHNVVRNNYVLNCTAAITVRHGNTCLVENNVIIYEDDFETINGLRGNGIRLFDKDHVVRNNYIYGVTGVTNSSFNGAIVIHNGGNAIGTNNGTLNGQWTAHNILIQNNTLINNDVNIALGDKNYSIAPGNITFDSNFVSSTTTTALRYFDNDSPKVSNTNTYTNEQYYTTGFGYPIEMPAGVSLFVDLLPTTQVVNGLVCLDNGSNAGALGLSIIGYSEVGPRTELTDAVRMTKTDYLAYFMDWPV
ncbi:MAG: InlB B-repeat-containing protein [bacterium]